MALFFLLYSFASLLLILSSSSVQASGERCLSEAVVYSGPYGGWQDARNACQSQGLDLVTFYTQDDVNTLSSLCGSSGRPYCFAGFVDNIADGNCSFEFINGQPLIESDFNFLPGEPDHCYAGSPTSAGGVITDDNRLADYVIVGTNAFLGALCGPDCDLTFAPSFSPTDKPSLSPTDRPTLSPTTECIGKAFSLTGPFSGWEEAREACWNNGGDLITFNTQEEVNEISRMCREDAFEDYCFVGFFDYIADSNCIFEFINGETFEITDFNFMPGEPDHCLAGSPTTAGGVVTDNNQLADFVLVGTNPFLGAICSQCNLPPTVNPTNSPTSPYFQCYPQCEEVTSQYGCANNECLENCRNCILDIAWYDYQGGQSNACQCHNNGCDQCNDGYFKIDYDFPCQPCNEFIGCTQCTDFWGCQQCEDGYTLIEDTIENCGENSYLNTGNVKIHYCIPNPPSPTSFPTVSVINPSPTQTPIISGGADNECPNYDYTTYNDCSIDENCSSCQPWGCAQCKTGYYKMGNNMKCQSCNDNYGNNCNQCNDWNGCTQCNNGYQLEYSTDCGDEICV